MNNNELIDFINHFIEKNADVYRQISDAIWAKPETLFTEYYAAELLSTTLEKAGFQVERGIANIETAFVASYGSGKPVIAILGEYDALPGLSQQSACDFPSPIEKGGNGHGCGHNLLGTAALAAAEAVKAYMQQHNLSGTIRYYGCPAEEGGSGKTFMVREGVFADVDIALTWHPESFSGIFNISTLANIQASFRFTGTASHAANSPHLGRSALDAVTLMNVGTNFLNEHLIQEARVHYAITNTGGNSPNVVQPEAEVLYLVRAPQLAQTQDIYERVIKIAQGAAMMTETKVEVSFKKACSNYVPNHALEQIMYQHMLSFGAPNWEKQDYALADAISKQLTPADRDNTCRSIMQIGGNDAGLFIEQIKDKTLIDQITPYQITNQILYASSDVGDVSWVTPTAQCFTSCFTFGTALHTWQLVSQGNTSIAHKGMNLAGKVIAATALTILLDPQHLLPITNEFNQYRSKYNYQCPIPKDIKPQYPSK